jgi:hypothetical protein
MAEGKVFENPDIAIPYGGASLAAVCGPEKTEKDSREACGLLAPN